MNLSKQQFNLNQIHLEKVKKINYQQEKTIKKLLRNIQENTILNIAINVIEESPGLKRIINVQVTYINGSYVHKKD